jgi:hypothetical protein
MDFDLGEETAAPGARRAEGTAPAAPLARGVVSP